MSVTETAFAKLNLALHVRARGADGYHAIETIFAFAEDGDRLDVEHAADLSLVVEGPFAASLQPEEDNLVLRAARAIQRHFGVGHGALVRLRKNLPVASGLGGGSADAAAAARALSRLWGLDATADALINAVGDLGADIPACVHSTTLRADGRGDRFTEIDETGLTGLPVLIANPRVPLATGPVFAAWDEVDKGPLSTGDPMPAALEGRNDLQPGAVKLCPLIEDGLAGLHGHGEVMSRMSGSGASIFAIYPDRMALDAAAADFERSHPNWWRMKTRLR